MIKISPNYPRKVYSGEKLFFDISSNDPTLLINFVAEYGHHFEKNNVRPEELDAGKITFPWNHRDLMEIYINRFNLILKGHKFQSEKQEFLNAFKMEAVKGVIYATLWKPKTLSIEQYATVVISTYERYTDSVLFGQRLIEVAECKYPQDYEIVTQQVRLFTNLLSDPLSTSPDYNQEENNDGESIDERD